MYQIQKRKNLELLIKISELYQVSQRFQYSPIVYIKSITQQKSVLLLFSHPLALKSSTIYWDATPLALILHLSFFKIFGLFKFNMLDKKAILITLKIKTTCSTEKLF